MHEPPMCQPEDELGVKTVETPHHCWKDARIQTLETLISWAALELANGRKPEEVEVELLRALAGKEVDGG